MAARKEAGTEGTQKGAGKKPTQAKEVMTKALMVNEIAANTGLNKKEVSAVLQELTLVVERHVRKGAVGKFILPGLIKIEVITKPARKARKGINPRTGEPIQIGPRPKRRAVRVRPLKGLRDMIA